jgi:hypothetical protein
LSSSDLRFEFEFAAREFTVCLRLPAGGARGLGGSNNGYGHGCGGGCGGGSGGRAGGCGGGGGSPHKVALNVHAVLGDGLVHLCVCGGGSGRCEGVRRGCQGRDGGGGGGLHPRSGEWGVRAAARTCQVALQVDGALDVLERVREPRLVDRGTVLGDEDAAARRELGLR